MFLRKNHDYDLIIIGSGAGGSVGAHYGAALGKKVAVFEKGAIGGECPNFACVPTKALLQSGEVFETAKNAKTFGITVKNASFDYEDIFKRKNLVVARTGTSHGKEAFEKSGVHIIQQEAKFVSAHEVEAGGKRYSSHKFIIATGSKVFVPEILGLKAAKYITFREAVDLRKPPKSLFIIGGGAVACEFAQIFSIFGTKVTIAARSKLLSNEDSEVSDLVTALFENRGIKVLAGVTVDRIEKKNGKKIVSYKFGGKSESVEVEEILIATGKTPVLDLDLEKARVHTNHSGIVVNKYLQTTNPNIFAAGDVVGPYLFTHSGEYQSYIAAHNAFSYRKIRVNYSTVPRCVFITPEVASVGISEQDAIKKGIRIKKGLAAISILGRANTSEKLDGFVKVITDKKGVIIGASIVAPRAGEMIHELALALHLRLNANVLSGMIHAYPTYSEAIKIACSNVE